MLDNIGIGNTFLIRTPVAQEIKVIIDKWVCIKLKGICVGYQWLTPVILAIQEAKSWRITVQSQPWANSSKDPTWKKPNTFFVLCNGSSGRAPALHEALNSNSSIKLLPSKGNNYQNQETTYRIGENPCQPLIGWRINVQNT
jgi:hypothetical protein